MTKDKFIAYLKVQESGRTNMFSIATVCKLSKGKLFRDDCEDIMKNYSKYEKEFGVSLETLKLNCCQGCYTNYTNDEHQNSKVI